MPENMKKTPNRSPVSFCNIENVSRRNVLDAVERAVSLVDCKALADADRVFVKVNLLSQEVVPGQCTSPWVFEGVLRHLQRRGCRRIYYGDCDVASASQVERAVVNWGFESIGRKYGAVFRNLSTSELRKVYLGPVLGYVAIPAFLFDMDVLVTVPVVKTHCITPFTGALKNQWGLLPRARFQFHDVVHEAIAEINRFFDKFVLGVADLTIAMEGPGPRVGVPKMCDLVMASTDLVALDSVIAAYMGFEPETIGFIESSEALGVGCRFPEIVGDEFEKNPFLPGQGSDYMIYRWRDRLKKIPLLRDVIFTVPAYRILGYFATKYNLMMWYNTKGKKLAAALCERSNYGKEFSHLIGR